MKKLYSNNNKMLYVDILQLNELSVIKNENEEVTENTTRMGTKLSYF